MLRLSASKVRWDVAICVNRKKNDRPATTNDPMMIQNSTSSTGNVSINIAGTALKIIAMTNSKPRNTAAVIKPCRCLFCGIAASISVNIVKQSVTSNANPKANATTATSNPCSIDVNAMNGAIAE